MGLLCIFRVIIEDTRHDLDVIRCNVNVLEFCKILKLLRIKNAQSHGQLNAHHCKHFLYILCYLWPIYHNRERVRAREGARAILRNALFSYHD